ncbi:MAG TPA: prefoldin subunit beta [Nitrosopumilaceae archaeon]|nr:prefoldin subunit beta [Nitrosopumilaceae archaeon]
MSSGGQQIPPWLQEQVGRLQQLQQNLQSIMGQKQHLEMENLETERALEVLKKAADTDTVYKSAGTILIKSTKANLIAELEEKKELSNTRVTVLSKQEVRVKENLKEVEDKIKTMLQGTTGSNPTQKTDTSK